MFNSGMTAIISGQVPDYISFRLNKQFPSYTHVGDGAELYEVDAGLHFTSGPTAVVDIYLALF
jgi:transcriptional regulator GlxA family with amidase domain